MMFEDDCSLGTNIRAMVQNITSLNNIALQHTSTAHHHHCIREAISKIYSMSTKSVIARNAQIEKTAFFGQNWVKKD